MKPEHGTRPVGHRDGRRTYRTSVTDPLIPYVAWIGPLLQRPFPDEFVPGSVAHAVLTELRDGWALTDTTELLTGLTHRYGSAAQAAVGRFLELQVRQDWAATGEREAHEGTEVADYVRLQWDPLRDAGFEYSAIGDATEMQLCVTRCPVREAAVATGMQSWMYTLSCAADAPSATGFSRNIEFRRSQTLMQGDTNCDHHYRRRT